MNQSEVSKRYYHFEKILEDTAEFAHLRKRMSLGRLQCLAGLVWAREGGRGQCPPVRGRRATDFSQYLYTPGSGETGVIHLVPKHQNAAGLLHEMAHALGHRDKLTHGRAFRNRCLRLYREYGDWSGLLVEPS